MDTEKTEKSEKSEKTVQLNILRLQKYPKHYKTFLTNIKTVLQKIGSSSKTKAIHEVVEKEIVHLGFGTVDISGRTASEFGSQTMSSGKLNALVADVKNVVDASDRTEAAKLYTKFVTASQELSKAKTTITDATEININRIEKELEQTLTDIIDLIDFFKLVDVYYYLYIEALAKTGIKGKGKIKLFETLHEVLRDSALKTVKKYSKDDLTSDKLNRFDVAFDYIFTANFTGASTGSIMSKLNGIHGKDKTEFLREMGVTKYTNYKNLGEILTKAHVINITDNMIMKELAKNAGEKIETIIEGDMVEVVAYLISTLYKSTLFESKVINEESQKRLEELVLNFKRDLVVSKS